MPLLRCLCCSARRWLGLRLGAASQRQEQETHGRWACVVPASLQANLQVGMLQPLHRVSMCMIADD
jgi:hypothetical protein